MFTITILSKGCLLKHEFGRIIKTKGFGYQQCLYRLPERQGSVNHIPIGPKEGLSARVLTHKQSAGHI